VFLADVHVDLDLVPSICLSGWCHHKLSAIWKHPQWAGGFSYPECGPFQCHRRSLHLQGQLRPFASWNLLPRLRPQTTGKSCTIWVNVAALSRASSCLDIIRYHTHAKSIRPLILSWFPLSALCINPLKCPRKSKLFTSLFATDSFLDTGCPY